MATFNVSNHASNLPNYGGVNETIIVHETTIFAFHVGYPNSPNITVNLESPGADWIGGFSQAPGSHLTITSGGEFTADGPSTANGSTYIGTNVVSLGAPTINEFQTHSSGKLEFAHSVASTVTVTDSGSGSGGDHGVIQVDSPLNYHAPTELGFGEIILEGLKATSYSYHNDMLTLFNGKSVIDTLNLSVQSVGGSAPSHFGVSQVGGSVVVHADGQAFRDGGRLLAMHG